MTAHDFLEAIAKIALPFLPALAVGIIITLASRPMARYFGRRNRNRRGK